MLASLTKNHGGGEVRGGVVGKIGTKFPNYYYPNDL